MTIQVNISSFTPTVGAFYYQVKEFLKANGWTVAGSSDGATGGMDAVDRIVNDTIINAADRWIVLQSPHATPADRIQLLFGKTDSNVNNGLISFCPEADYVGVTTAVPTSGTAKIVRDGLVVNGADMRMTMLVDDTAPYGWALLLTPLGNPTLVEGGMGLIPLDLSVAPDNPGKPYVFYMADDTAGSAHWKRLELCSTTDSTSSTGRCVAQGNNTTSSFIAPAAYLAYSSSTIIMPVGSQPDVNGRDVASPIIFQSSTYFFGSSTFARWNGTLRNSLDTLSDGVSDRARIIFGDVSLPWDGTTVPLP